MYIYVPRPYHAYAGNFLYSMQVDLSVKMPVTSCCRRSPEDLEVSAVWVILGNGRMKCLGKFYSEHIKRFELGKCVTSLNANPASIDTRA